MAPCFCGLGLSNAPANLLHTGAIGGNLGDQRGDGVAELRAPTRNVIANLPGTGRRKALPANGRSLPTTT